MAKGATKEEIARGMSGSYLTLDPTLCGGRWALQIAGPNVAARTRMAAERVAELLRCGCDPSDIAVVCSGPQSVGFVRRTLADVAGPGLAEQAQVVDVTVARKLAFDVLSHPRSQQSVGRVFPSSRPRLLAAFEENVVLEDLKTIGMRPKRLREVLKFIYRGWTELADEGEGWLLTVEEHDIVEFIHAELSYLQGVLEPELCNLAVKAVRKVGASELGVARKHVIACEYQNLSRASQLLCNAIASESIVISADAKACAEVCDSYPYAQGVEEFFQVNPGAETLHAPEGAFVKACVGRWDNPWEEIDATADAVGRLVAEGVPAANVAVVCLHPLWHRLMVRALESRGVAASALHAPLVFKNDVRDLNDSCATRVVTALRLLADGADSMAWRCWIGFGDYLAKSNVFVERRQRRSGSQPRCSLRGSCVRFCRGRRVAAAS